MWSAGKACRAPLQTRAPGAAFPAGAGGGAGPGSQRRELSRLQGRASMSAGAAGPGLLLGTHGGARPPRGRLPAERHPAPQAACRCRDTQGHRQATGGPLGPGPPTCPSAEPHGGGPGSALAQSCAGPGGDEGQRPVPQFPFLSAWAMPQLSRTELGAERGFYAQAPGMRRGFAAAGPGTADSLAAASCPARARASARPLRRHGSAHSPGRPWAKHSETLLFLQRYV